MAEEKKIEEFVYEPEPEVHLEDVIGEFETVTSEPTKDITTLNNQVKIRVDGATLRLYVYSDREKGWYYVNLTAV